MGRSGDPWEGGAPSWDQGPYRSWGREPDRPVATHRPRRLRAALLLATAFVATVTGVISGVRLIAAASQPSGTPADLGDVPPCPPNSDCAALFPPRVTPTTAATPTAEPSGEPTGAVGDPGGTPTGNPATDAPDTAAPSAEPPARVPSPRAGRTASARPAPKPSPTASVADPGVRLRPSPAPTVPRAMSPAPRPTEPDPAPEEPPRAERDGPSKAVVKFIVTSERYGRYSAEIAIGNEGHGDLDGWEITLPIDGRVVAVEGARAVQRGDTLVLRSAEFVPSGGGVAVRIAVRGEPVAPGFCRLRGGDCRLLSDRL